MVLFATLSIERAAAKGLEETETELLVRVGELSAEKSDCETSESITDARF